MNAFEQIFEAENAATLLALERFTPHVLLEVVHEREQRIERTGGGNERRARFLAQLEEQPSEVRRRDFPFATPERFDELGPSVRHRPVPEIVEHVVVEVLEIRNELGAELDAALQRVISEHALTKPVNRGDRRLVDAFERTAQLFALRRGRPVAELGRRADELAAHALAKLGSRRFGERDDEDRARVETPLHDETPEKRRNGVRLAGTGARLDEILSRKLDALGVEGQRLGAHPRIPPA